LLLPETINRSHEQSCQENEINSREIEHHPVAAQMVR
jgi:hypothetical protein